MLEWQEASRGEIHSSDFVSIFDFYGSVLSFLMMLPRFSDPAKSRSDEVG